MQNRIIRKALLAIAAGAIGALAVAAPALATTVSVGGGTWQYGVTVSNYSNYYHGSKAHRSSVDNSVAGLVRSGCVSSGQWLLPLATMPTGQRTHAHKQVPEITWGAPRN